MIINMTAPQSNRHLPSERLSDRPSERPNERVFETHPMASQTRIRCHLCGFAEVRTDEVEDRGVVFLAECPRCENRWTSRVPIERPLSIAGPRPIENRPPIATPVASRFQRVPARVARVVAPAA